MRHSYLEIVDDNYERLWIDPTPGFIKSRGGVLIPEPTRKKAPTAIDLFAGCGGFSLGMELAGIDVVAAMEWDHSAVMTYMHNLGHPDGRIVYMTENDKQKFEKSNALEEKRTKRRPARTQFVDIDDWFMPGTEEYRQKRLYNQAERRAAGGMSSKMPGAQVLFFGDVRLLTAQMIIDELGFAPEICFGGPPCQGFSTASSKNARGTTWDHDPRNNLVLEFLRVAIELNVDAFCMENVAPLITHQKYAPLRERFVEIAEDAGYIIAADVLNAYHYGVPQHRPRSIFIGYRRTTDKAFQFPMPTHWGNLWGHENIPEDEYEPGEYEEKVEVMAEQMALFLERS